MDIEQVDESLITQYYNCDDVALEQLCLRYWKRLYVFLRRPGVSLSDVEDLVQETMIKVAGTKDRLHSRYRKGNVGAWILTIAKNTLFDFFRKNDQPVPFAEMYWDNEEGNTGSVEDSAIETVWSGKAPDLIATIAFDECVFTLKHEEQFVIMSILQGLTLDEVAKLLEITPSAVFRLKKRAIRQLRDCLQA
jgi:RNA polymerase sigma factor (sigma-70 family)